MRQEPWVGSRTVPAQRAAVVCPRLTGWLLSAETLFRESTGRASAIQRIAARIGSGAPAASVSQSGILGGASGPRQCCSSPSCQ